MGWPKRAWRVCSLCKRNAATVVVPSVSKRRSVIVIFCPRCDTYEGKSKP